MTGTLESRSRHVDRLRRHLRGHALGPGDPGYDAARAVHNGGIDRRPAVIVRCAGVDDVVAAIGFAQDHALPLAVRGGGHDVNGFAVNDGGLVVDLSPMRDVTVDPAARTARVGGGARWGDLDRAAQPYGLATPGANVSSVGVAGATLGGGIGYLSRRYGLCCDNLASVELVTAGGAVLTVSEEREPELFWALRGGGGNFGVVTSFEFRLHPVGTVLAGPILYRADVAREVLGFFRDHMASAPAELGGFVGFHLAGQSPFLPPADHGEPVCVISVCHVGDHEAGRRAIRPLLRVGPPAGHGVRPMPYAALQRSADGSSPPGLKRYWRGEFTANLPDGLVEIHAAHGARVPYDSSVHISTLDGAVGAVAPSATAFAYRDAGNVVLVAGVWSDPAEAGPAVAWADGYWGALRPHSAGGSYANFMMDEGRERVAAAFGRNYGRLVGVKRRYDPANLFGANHNIR